MKIILLQNTKYESTYSKRANNIFIFEIVDTFILYTYVLCTW